MKNNLLCTPDKRVLFKRVLFLSETYPGSVHDKAIGDSEAYAFPAGLTLDQDAGYQGQAPAGVTVRQPQQKPRGKPRPPEQLAYNRVCSQQRVAIEHASGLCKRWRVLRDTLRLRRDGLRDLVMELGCGLHNLRLTYQARLTL